MSLQPHQPIPPVPDDTARIARAACGTRNPYLILRERLGSLFTDADFADLYPKRGQPAYAPWRLALVTVLQFRERAERSAGGGGGSCPDGLEIPARAGADRSRL